MNEGGPKTQPEFLPPRPVLEGSSAMFASCFVGGWSPVKRTSGYKASLVGSALIVCLVPMVYLAVIAAVVWGLWLYYTNQFGTFDGDQTRQSPFVLVLHLFPGMMGIVTVVLLIRPLPGLFRSYDAEDDMEIFPREEPRLFGFVEAVCETMGSPVPERICIDCSVNAGAQVTRGTLFGRRELTLHIGLPLVAGMDSTEFAGVLAHEFGHFSQGSGMHATAVLLRVTHWMGLAAFERGGVDEWIVRMRQSNSAIMKVLSLIADLSAWITRRLLQAVFFFAYGVARFMGRRMEFDADAHQARFVGSEAAVRAWPRILALHRALQNAEAKVAEQWRSKRLPEDFPGFVSAISRRLSPDDRAHVQRDLEDTKTGWLDSHPATATRLAAMKALDEKGVFRLDAPASSLFTNFGNASRRVSYSFFKRRVGEAIFSATFVPSAEIFGSSEEEQMRYEAARRYLGFEPPEWRPLTISADAFTFESEPKACWDLVNKAKARLAKAAPIAREAEASYFKSQRALRFADAAAAVFAVGVKRLPKEFELGFSTEPAMVRVRSAAIETAAEATASMDGALEAGSARVRCALRMLAFPGIERRMPEAPNLKERGMIVLRAHEALIGILPRMAELQSDFLQMGFLTRYVDDPAHREHARESFRLLSDRVREGVLSARQDLGGIPSPYRNVDGQVSLGGFVSTQSPAWREYGQILDAASELLAKFGETQSRIGLELASLAAHVETSLRATSVAPSAAPATPGAR